MATSNTEENETKMEGLDDASLADLRRFLGDDADEIIPACHQIGQRTVSMFCKSCLHPYTGEQKSNAIVLRCELCGQTDTIVEEDAMHLNPEDWQGNLVLRRFVQVIKDQEALRINVSDPFYADDDYQKYHLAVTEYAFNMKLIAEKVSELMQATKEAHMRKVLAYRANKEYKRKVASNDDNSTKDKTEKNIGEKTDCGDDKGDAKVDDELELNVNDNKSEECLNEGSVKEFLTEDRLATENQDISSSKAESDEDSEAEDDFDDSSDGEPKFGLSEKAKDEMRQLQPKFLQLMKKLILKYGLPTDIIQSVKARMLDPNFVEEVYHSDDQDEDESNDEEERKAHDDETVRDGACVLDNGAVKSDESVDSGVCPDNAHIEEPSDGSEETKKKRRKKKKPEVMQFGIKRKNFVEEFYGALRSKFDIQFVEGQKVEIGTDSEYETDEEDNEVNEDKNEVNDYTDELQVTTKVENKVVDAHYADAADICEDIKDVDEEKSNKTSKNKSELDLQDVHDQVKENIPEIIPVQVSVQVKKSETVELQPEVINKTIDQPGAVEINEPRVDILSTHDISVDKIEANELETGLNENKNKEEKIDVQEVQQVEEPVFAIEENDKDEAKEGDDDDDDDDEEGNPLSGFHLLSSAFIRVMQERKQLALTDRKNKALEFFNEKVEKLKRDVMAAEERAKEELTKAFENKKRKIENQRKMLDKKRHEMKLMEMRMRIYAQTGQQDKLNELLRKFNSEYEAEN